MLEAAINNLCVGIYDSGIVSRVGNIAEEVGIVQKNGDVRRLPAAQIAPFTTGKMEAITPDDKESAVTWWECGPTGVLRQTDYLMQLENTCTLLMWINTARLSPADDTIAQRSIVGTVLNTPYVVEDGDSIRAVVVEYAGQVFDERLSKFGWDNPEFQMSIPPYKLAAHRFTITYTVSRNCQPVITTKTKTC